MKPVLFALLLAAVLAWEYAPVLRGGFVYEDGLSVDACDGAAYRWVTNTRPLTAATWCWQVKSHQPMWAFHALNLGLHLVVTGLVGALAWTLTRSTETAWWAAAIFGINAVGVESVAYLSGRSELIAAVGVLGACLAVLTARWAFVAPLLLIGWWGKETASGAAMLVPLCLWYARRRWWAWVVVLGGLVLSAGILWRTQTWLVDAPLGAWALLQATALARLLVLSVCPFGQTVDYDYARVPIAIQFFAAACVVGGAVGVLGQRTHRLVILAVAWVVCAAAPRVIVYTPGSVFSEHQFYLPLVGVALGLAAVFTKESYVLRPVLAHA